MANFFKKKNQNRDSSGPPSRQFYVEFLGWLPCRGIRGNIYTNAIAYELIQRKSQFPDVPKMTLQVSPNEIKISNDNSEEHRKEKITSVKYPCIMMKNVTFATCMTSPNDDIVNCIYFAYNPVTRSMLHTHVYRFDSPSTATGFVELLNKVVNTHPHQTYVDQLEEKLREDGYLQPIVESPPPQLNYLHRSPWDTKPNAPPPPVEPVSPEPEPYIGPEILNMQAIASELNQKFRTRDGPLLLPPKDYDTVHRKHGKLDNIGTRKCLNEVYVGRAAVQAASFKSGNESLLEDEVKKEQDKITNDAPIYYPPKLDRENTHSPTQVGSPPIMRRELLRGNSSAGSDRNNRSSYPLPSQSSPPPVTQRGRLSSYENYPTLKTSDRSPIATSSPDMPRWDKSHLTAHTRQSSMSSTHSGVSSHSDRSQKMFKESELEIPPDYDEAPQNPETRVPKNGNLDYRRSYERQNYYDPHRGPEPIPNMANAYPSQRPTYYQPSFDPSELYAKPTKPTKAISPLQR